jgi:endoglucanase
MKILKFIIFFNIFNTVFSWFVKNNMIWYDDNTIFHLKGANWFGYDTDCNIVNGLWINSLDYYFNLFSNELNINALRIPFGFETIEQWDNPPKYECLTADPWINKITIKDSLHILFKKAIEHKIVILLDFHTIEQKITDYLLSDNITIDKMYEMWRKIMNEFQQYKNFLGIDIKNEPHGNIQWDEWSLYVSNIITFIHSNFPKYKGLYFIEGLEDQSSNSVWGGSFTYLNINMLKMLPMDKIVFSPHIYGVSVRGDIAEQDTYALFDYWFGNLKFRFHQNPIILGEIGGMNIGTDLDWHNKIKNYLKKRDYRDVFYWCLNPNSYDTGGLLMFDWKTIDYSKVKFQHDLQPNVTRMTFPLPNN